MRRFFFILFLLSFLPSCEKLVLKEDYSSTDPYVNFAYLWHACDEQYAYFDLKGINWDNTRHFYGDQISPGISDDSLFNVLGNMLKELKDDHTNLISNFNVSFFGTVYQGPDNFDWRIIEDNYLSQDYYHSGPFLHDFIENEEVGYIRLKNFTSTINNTNLDFILNRYKDTKGLILDLRENGGGAISGVFKILSRFVNKETLVYYSRIKNGPGHNDFSEPEAAYLSPYTGTKYLKKVFILTDRGTYSAGSFTALAAKEIPNITLVGDTTGGGLGLPNGGQLPNGWTYRFSVSQTLTTDLDPSFENGVPPDVIQLFDWDDRTKDEVIEKVLRDLL
ncbi:MAG: peptidase S41 [Bacteroidetes bacterium]|nr:MAG: peptidase S41 [Bacteroidota bacterium]